MKALREQRDLCDVILCIDNEEFPVHKVVLAAGSPYFNAMFTNEHMESRQARVALNGINAATLECLLDYVYSSSLEVREDNVQNILAGASLLQLTPVVEACCEFIQVRLDHDNCLGIAAFAEMHGCVNLREISWWYVMANFSEVAQGEEFLGTPQPYLMELLKSEDLNVKSEEEVLDCVLRWFKHDELSRKDGIYPVLQCVKLPLIPWQVLNEKILSNGHLSSVPECHLLLTEAKHFQADPEAATYADNQEYSCRKSCGQSLFVYAVGGEASPGRSTVSSMERFDPEVKNNWVELAPMKSSRRGVGVEILDGLLYTVGGSDGVHALCLVECYDLRANCWKRVADMNEERSSVAAAVLNGYLYAVGGYDGIMSCLPSVEQYDPATNTWSYVPEMNVPRSMMGTGVVNNKLFAVGGYDGTSDLASCEMYDPEVNSWVGVEAMHSRRSLVGVSVLEGLLYAVGGSDWSQSLSSVEVYNPETNQWSLLMEMSEPRSGVGVAVVGRKLYAAGGYSGSGDDYCSTVESYDPKTDTWSYVASLRTGRSRFGCCS